MMSALSFISAQNLAAIQATILANMKPDELNKSQLSPSSQPSEASNSYADFGSPINMLSSQMLASQMFQPHVAATLLAQLNASTSNFYPQSLIPWHLSPIGTSPPISPISPALSVKSVKKINTNNNTVTTTTDDGHSYEFNVNHLGGDNKAQVSIKSTDMSGKKMGTRKINNFKKKRNQMLYQPYTNLETSQTTEVISLGPISPPTSGLSGSSPQSIGSVDHQSPSSSSIHVSKVPNTTRDKTFPCQWPGCNRSFGYKHVLQNHERTHTGEKPFACPEPECGKRFTRDHHLKTHMRLHTGEKPYHCEHCDRQFVQVANLRRHLRVHTGEKPYACGRCDAKYSDSNQLKAHMIIHKDEKPFQCEMCNTSFRRSHHLVNHKCSNAPLTPATSPVISMENKSIASRSDGSERSLDLTTPGANLFNHFKLNKNLSAAQQTQVLQQIYESTLSMSIENSSYEMPLDLSVESNSEYGEKRNNRKSNDPCHILRMPKIGKMDINNATTSEQTEPEDLSMHSPRSESPLLSEEDLDDLDDAEALNRKHQRTNHQIR